MPLLTCWLLLSLPRAQAGPGDFVACFGGPGATPAPPSCSFADYDKDGDVDLFDFSMYSEYCAGVTGSTCTNDTQCNDNDITTLDECFKCGSETYCNNEALSGYPEWLAANPKFMQATFTSGWFEPDVINQTWKDIRLLERIRRVHVPLPQEFLDCREPQPCTSIAMTDPEVRVVLAARAAHMAWVDKNFTPWHVEEFDADNLHWMIFRYMPYIPQLRRYYGVLDYVVDHSPSEAFEYAKRHLKATIAETIESVFDDVRIDFEHGGTPWDPTETAYTPKEALTTYVTHNGITYFRIARAGCHSMDKILEAELASLNIPARETDGGQYFYVGHSSLILPTEHGTLSHGDDIYDPALDGAPSLAFPVLFVWYTQNKDQPPCWNDKGCLAERKKTFTRAEFPSNYTLDICCHPNAHGYGTCEQYVQQRYGPFLLSTEIPVLTAQLTTHCP